MGLFFGIMFKIGDFLGFGNCAKAEEYTQPTQININIHIEKAKEKYKK